LGKSVEDSYLEKQTKIIIALSPPSLHKSKKEIKRKTLGIVSPEREIMKERNKKPTLPTKSPKIKTPKN